VSAREAALLQSTVGDSDRRTLHVHSVRPYPFFSARYNQALAAKVEERACTRCRLVQYEKKGEI
jgi:hypothetical protein